MTTVVDNIITTPISETELNELRELSTEARLEGPSGALPLTEVSAETSIEGLIATTRYLQRFLNPSNDHLEVSYIFPLPSRAGVTDFVATLGGRRIEGILKERGQARADYAQALAESKRAALLESERSDVFTAKIGNIAPHEEAVIELVVTGPVVVEDGEVTFRFPLVCAPRYITGEILDVEPAGVGTTPDTDSVPDASRLNPPLLSQHQSRPALNFIVTITHPGLKTKALSTSHPMSVVEKSASGVKKSASSLVLTLAAGEKMDADLLVRFSLPKELTMQALLSDDLTPSKRAGVVKEKVGTWAVSVVAPRQDSMAPRDIVFVLDRSGSMDGWKMVAARRAAARLIDSLLPEDRFSVVAFDNKMDVFKLDVVGREEVDSRADSELGMFSGTDRNRFAAVSWLAGIAARGGTQMRRPLRDAVDLLSGTAKDREPVLVLVTDGQIGAEAQLLSSLEPRLGRTRFCVVGIDRAPNTALLERLSRRTNGYVTFVESEDRLDEALRNLHRRVGRPELLGVSVSLEGAELIGEETAPGRAVDVFSGVPCLITGRYRRTGTKAPALRVSAQKADGSGTFDVEMVTVESTAKGIGDTWARSRMADLEDRYDAQGGTNEGLRAAIIDLSVSSRVLSRFTAFVAVDAESQEISSSHEMVQPVGAPGGWAVSGMSLSLASVSTRPALRSFSRQRRMSSSPATRLIGSTQIGARGQSTHRGLDAFLGVPKGTAPFAEARNSVISLLEECLNRLKLAAGNRRPPIADLVRQLRQLQSVEPSVLAALGALNGYMTWTTSLDDTIKAIEDSLRILRSREASGPRGKRVPSASLREFWS